MPKTQFESIVAAPLEKVWTFHQDVSSSLVKLSQPQDRVQLERADDPPVVGARIIIVARGPFGKRIRWVARIVEHVAPHAVVFGEEARFVDEQESGPFARWRHAHEFERIDEKTTRIIDRIDYAVGFGPIGWLADKLFVARKLSRMFAYRHAMTKQLLEEAT